MNTKMSESTRCYEIIAGPNRDVLFEACKYAYDKAVRIPVDFSVAVGYTMPRSDPSSGFIKMYISNVKIVRIEHESGSGDSFNLYGFCNADPDSLSGSAATCGPYEFEAYYNTKTRTGTISFTLR